ncbi:MAG: transporter substrate-binding domain-containing protein [Beijerinckiaceae bacterium]
MRAIVAKAVAAAFGSILLGVTATAAVAQGLPPLPESVRKAGVIRIGVKCDSPPFGASGADGKPVGIEVEMAKKIGEFAFGSEKGAELSCVTSEARIPSLNGGKIDLILATLGRFPAREEVIDFSNIYYWGTSNVLVPKDSPAKTLADLKGKSILIVKGGAQIKWMRENIPGVSFVQLNTTSDSVQALLQGRADGFVGDGGLAYTLAANYPQLRIIEEGVDPGVNGIGLRKGEKELKAFVDAALDKLRADGFYQKLVPQFVTDKAVATITLKGFVEPPPAR